MPLEYRRVVALERQALARPERSPGMITPVPVKLTVHIVRRVLRADARAPIVARQDAGLVTRLAQRLGDPRPDDLVAAQVVGRIAAADREDSNRRRHAPGS